jgi:hypothetical protein
MSVLAVRCENDIKRLHEAVRTNFEKDLLETLLHWRFCHDETLKLIKQAAEIGLKHSAGED